MPTSRRSFVLRQTTLQAVPDLGPIRLHLADDVLGLWHALQVETGDPDASLPYWAFAWGGGLALARYLAERPDVVAGRRVLDLASGSGLCAIAAAQAGAGEAIAVDIDPFAVAAIGLNSRANRIRISATTGDPLDEAPPDVELILAGDVCYDASFAKRAVAWLRRAHDAGIDVLIGDPGRRYLPTDELVELAAYEVRTTTDLEDLALKRAGVYAFA